MRESRRPGERHGAPLLADQLLSVNQRVRRGAVVLTVVGIVDSHGASLLRGALDKALRHAVGRPVVVDLLGVSVLAPAALAVLVHATQQATRQPGKRHQPLRVVVDHEREPLRTIQTTGLEQALTLCRSVDEALTI